MKMLLPRFISVVTAFLSALNGLIIIGNDVIVGIKNPQPLISLFVGFIFCAIGFLIWQIGDKLYKLRLHLMHEAVGTYKMLTVYLNAILLFYGIVMLIATWALIERIHQGYSIFG